MESDYALTETNLRFKHNPNTIAPWKTEEDKMPNNHKNMPRGPGLICIGMPKCGTSTLYKLLEKNDKFFVTPIKEINYFAFKKFKYGKSITDIVFANNWISKQHRRAIISRIREAFILRKFSKLPWLAKFIIKSSNDDWYRKLFPEGRIGVDISPIYCELEPAEIDLVRAAAPDAKIIIMLRSPLEQLWSHSRMILAKGEGSSNGHFFRDHLDRQIAASGSYSSLIANWSAVYPGRVLVLEMSDMVSDLPGFLRRLLAFFDFDPAIADTIELTPEHANEGKRQAMPKALRPHLANAARARLEGFDAIDPALAAKWRAEIDRFEAGELAL